MKLMKKCVVLALVVAMVASICACGCSRGGKSLKESDITGAQVQEEFWNTDLDASAEFLNGYRAQSLEEVIRNWRQAKMQGNGAILYSLYSSNLKEIYLIRIKNEFGMWNFFYGNESLRPYEVTCSTPQIVEGVDGMYYSTITTIEGDGVTTNTYDIYIELVDGGYFVTSETAPVALG